MSDKCRRFTTVTSAGGGSFTGGTVAGATTFNSAVTFLDTLLLPGTVDEADILTIAAGNNTADRTLTLLATADITFTGDSGNFNFDVPNAASKGHIFQIGGSGKVAVGNDGTGHVLALDNAVNIQWGNGVLAAPDIGLARNAAGVLRATSTAAKIRGFLGGGAAVASATAMPVPTGRIFHVTGTTDITSITSTNFEAGAVVTLIFDDVLTFTDGNNLVLAGNLATTANDTITLAYDGTSWFETSRSVN